MPPMIAQIQKAPLTLPGTDSGGTKRDSHAITTKTENTNWNTLNLNAFRCVFTSWWNVSLNKVVGQLARQVKLKEKDFIEYNSKNHGRALECPREYEFWSGGQNCTTNEPENVREIFFSGTWIMTEQNAVSQVTRQGKTKQVQTELSFKRPQCFHKTNSAPTQLSFKCQLRKFPSDLAIFLRTTSNDAGICTCLWLCELYVYFSCLFEVYLGLFGDGACILDTVQCSWNVLNFRPWPKTFYSLCRCWRKRVPAVMLWFKSNRWLSIHTFCLSFGLSRTRMAKTPQLAFCVKAKQM